MIVVGTALSLRHSLHSLPESPPGGRLFGFGDVDELTGILETLLADGAERARLQRSAYAFARQMTWPAVGEAYVRLARRVLGEAVAPARRSAACPSFASTVRWGAV